VVDAIIKRKSQKGKAVNDLEKERSGDRQIKYNII